MLWRRRLLRAEDSVYEVPRLAESLDVVTPAMSSRSSPSGRSRRLFSALIILRHRLVAMRVEAGRRLVGQASFLLKTRTKVSCMASRAFSSSPRRLLHLLRTMGPYFL